MKLKLRSRVRFLAAIWGGTGIAIRQDTLGAYVDLDYSELNQAIAFDPTDSIVAIFHPSSGIWEKISLSTLQTAGQTQQILTSGAVVNAAATDGLIVLNKTVGSPTVVNLPASGSKIGSIKVSDFKGDSETNNIQIKTVGADVFPGGLTTWTISNNAGSLVFTPLKDGSGYSV